MINRISSNNIEKQSLEIHRKVKILPFKIFEFSQNKLQFLHGFYSFQLHIINIWENILFN